MASNLRPDDPCAGRPIPRLNRPKGHPSGVSNLRPPDLEDCEETGFLLALFHKETAIPYIIRYEKSSFRLLAAEGLPPTLQTLSLTTGLGISTAGDYHWILVQETSAGVDLYRSVDIGESWELNFPNISSGTSLPSGGLWGLPVEASDGTIWMGVATHPTSFDILEIHKSLDGGNSWELVKTITFGVDTGSVGNIEDIAGIAVDPTDPNRVALVVDDFLDGNSYPHIFFTENGGGSWEDALIITEGGNANTLGARNIQFLDDGILYMVQELDDIDGSGLSAIEGLYSQTPLDSDSYTHVIIDADPLDLLWGELYINGALQIEGDNLLCVFNDQFGALVGHTVFGSSDRGVTWFQLPDFPVEDVSATNAFYFPEEDVVYLALSIPSSIQPSGAFAFYKLPNAFSGGSEWEDLTTIITDLVGEAAEDLEPWFGIAITVVT